MFYAIALFVFITDQVSKAWIRGHMAWDETRPIVGDAFRLTLTRNTGGAWGLLPNANLLFIVFAIVAVTALLFAYYRMQRVDLLVGSAFSLALGGALGNLLDRIRFHYVVDFFEAKIIHWPIFNIADSAISLGIVLLLIHFLRSEESRRAPAVSLPAEDTGSSQG
jgi:signal peptidase II